MTSLTKSIARLSAVPFLLMMVCGLLVSGSIYILRGPSDFGIFSLGYSSFALTSQIGGLGIYHSILHYSGSQLSADRDTRSSILFSAVAVGFAGSISCATAIIVVLYTLPTPYDSATVYSIGIGAISASMFCTNKIVSFFISGAGLLSINMRIQSARYLLLLFFILFFLHFEVSGEHLVFAALGAEFILIFYIFLCVYRLGLRPMVSCYWMKKHLRYGLSNYLGSVFAELHSRYDLFLAGLLFDARTVGIYAVGSQGAEVLYRLLSTFRLNIEPSLVSISATGGIGNLQSVLRFTTRAIPVFSAALSIIALIVFYFIDRVPLLNLSLTESIPVLATLLAFLVFASPWIPLFGISYCVGFPWMYSIHYFFVFIFGLLMSVFLAFYWGPVGIAVGVGFGYLIGIVVLWKFVSVNFRWNIFLNRMNI